MSVQIPDNWELEETAGGDIQIEEPLYVVANLDSVCEACGRDINGAGLADVNISLHFACGLMLGSMILQFTEKK